MLHLFIAQFLLYLITFPLINSLPSTSNSSIAHIQHYAETDLHNLTIFTIEDSNQTRPNRTSWPNLNAEWKFSIDHSPIIEEMPEGDQLLLVQNIWRHGDRAPIGTFPTDPHQESSWPHGFGQLTALGMAQHVLLGKFIRRRYIDEMKFLSKKYRSDEIYITSTDTNRTIQSAIANMIGMWSGSGNWGVDYPDSSDWPSGYVPVPIHTYEYRNDPVGHARVHCQRAFELFDLTTKTVEYQMLNNTNLIPNTEYFFIPKFRQQIISYLMRVRIKDDSQILQELLNKISEYAGMRMTLANLWIIIEAVTIEKLHGLKPVEWAAEIVDQIAQINWNVIDYNSGLGLTPLFGINFQREYALALGGKFLWQLIGRMRDKVECQKLGTPADFSLCKWLQPLKYYVHSSHDMTLTALFSTFDFNYTDFDRPGFPNYASSLLIELWRRPSTDFHYIKVIYKRDQELLDITDSISGCEKECALEKFAERSLKYQPLPSQEELCRTPLFLNPSETITSSKSTKSMPVMIILMIALSFHWLRFNQSTLCL